MNSITNNFVYGFDTSGRLEQVTKNASVVANYGYDSNSNRNSGNVGAQPTTATYDDQDRLLTYNTLSFTYNANGDLLSKINSTTSQTTQYTYDVFGNLTKVILPGGTTTITYEIDGLNRRIGKKVNGVVQKRWVYMDQYRIAAELNSSGTITKRFIYGSKGNIPDYMIASGVKYRIISDHLGSPRLVVKQSDGTITQRMDHDEFGRVIEDTNPGYLPFGFAGGLYDNQTGLVRFGARDYDAETGRWTSKDPILFGGGDTNLFGYVAQDPENDTDPSGLYQACFRPLTGWPFIIDKAYHVYLCAPDSKGGMRCGGQGPSGSIFGSPGKDDSGGATMCNQGPKDKCVDACINATLSSNVRPTYDITNRRGVNCQAWASQVVNSCSLRCVGK
ncbi:MAG: RHS repeat domain-containing protein [Bdellovibrio sp.]